MSNFRLTVNSLKIAANVIKRIFKKPYSLIVLIIIPVLGMAFTVSVFNQNNKTKLMIANVNKNDPIVQIIKNTGKYDISFGNEKNIKNTVNSGRAEIGVIMPQNYKDNEKAKVFAKDKNDKAYEISALANEYINAIHNGNTSKFKAIKTTSVKLNAGNALDTKTQKLNTSYGFLLMFIFMFSGICMTELLEDREGRTFMRICASPVRQSDIVFGNFFCDALIGIVQISLLLVVSKSAFGIDFKVSFLKMFLILFIFYCAALGINLGLTGIIKSSSNLALANFILAGCLSALSGCFFKMGNTIEKAALFTPFKWSADCYKKLADGGKLYDIRMNILILLIMSCIFISFGIKTLKPDEEDL